MPTHLGPSGAQIVKYQLLAQPWSKGLCPSRYRHWGGMGGGRGQEEELRSSKTGQATPTGPPCTGQLSPGLQQDSKDRGARRVRRSVPSPLLSSSGTAPTSPACSGIPPHHLVSPFALSSPTVSSGHTHPPATSFQILSDLPFADKLLQRQFSTHVPSTPLLSHISFFPQIVPSLNSTIWKDSLWYLILFP